VPSVAGGGMGADAIVPDVDAIAPDVAEPAGAVMDGFVGLGEVGGCAELAPDVAGAGGVNGIGGVAAGGFAT
jgi:hypothetical protein